MRDERVKPFLLIVRGVRRTSPSMPPKRWKEWILKALSLKSVPHLLECFLSCAVGSGVFSASMVSRSSPTGFLSRAVIKVIKESMKRATPLTPAGGYPSAGTHHLRKFSFSYAYKYGVCNDLQQLWDRAGSKSEVTPIKTYIRNVPDITFYMCSPLGTLKPLMPSP